VRTIVRRLLSTIGLLLFTVVLLELISFVAYLVVEGEPFSYARFNERRAEILQVYEVPEGEVKAKDPLLKPGMVGEEDLQALHPFLGYVRNPAASRAQHQPNGPVNDFGWRGQGDPFHTGDDEATIVIVGGSVAFKNWSSKDILIDRIKALPQFQNKQVYYETLALEGYKQPSQLAAVAYYLALGGKIDILINLDGQNEVQYMEGVNYFPVYPRRWIALARGLGSPETLAVFGRAHLLKELRLRACQAASKASISVTANVFWHFLDRLMRSELDQLSAAAEGLAEEDQKRGKETRAVLPYWRRGPSFEGGIDERVRFSVNVWANSTVALAQLANGFGFYYFHFLQPSQYLSDSKPFSEEEREDFILPNGGKRIPIWYPRMLKQGDALRERGVRFFDLTEVFKDVRETTYQDWCCHLNQRGKDLVAQRMADIIVESIQSSPSAKSFEKAPQF
jgi:hypothetical protein